MGKQSVESVVFVYMKSQNRPYSASDVFLNLHKEYGKTAVVKAMENLAEENKLLEKVYGKSKIYVVHQSQFPSVDENELTKLDKEIQSLTEALQLEQTQLRECSAEVNKLTSSLTTTDAKLTVESLQAQIADMEKTLQQAKSLAKNIDPSKKKKIIEDHKTNVTHWRKRKRMTNDLMNAVLEGYPKSKKHFLEEVGIETDEEMSVKIPELK
uniref:Homologous-pairing protein 2 homolog n=1 Tax=Phallusia mammillata TaxID=59560 RepID=A0A6F9DPX1_9ASCI|nr:homologous-pairing protein 2 homolog [Phallusia mammillata]